MGECIVCDGTRRLAIVSEGWALAHRSQPCRCEATVSFLELANRTMKDDRKNKRDLARDLPN